MQCMKTRIFALAVVLATFASNASAATINIFYTGVITNVTMGTPVIQPGDPFTLSYFFDTALAAPGDYVNTGTSSLLRGSVPAVGSASLFTPGLGNVNPGSVCGGLPCTGNAQDSATTGSTSQGLTIQQTTPGGRLFFVGSALSFNPAIPGDITASFVLEGIGIGNGGFLFQSGAGFTANADFRIDSAIVNPVPLPAALPLFAAGLGIVTFLARRKKTKAIRPT